MRGLITLIHLILRLFEILLFIRAVLSWFPISRDNVVSRFLESATEPLLLPVRKLLYRIPALQNFPLDLSYIVVFLLIQLLSGIL